MKSSDYLYYILHKNSKSTLINKELSPNKEMNALKVKVNIIRITVLLL